MNSKMSDQKLNAMLKNLTQKMPDSTDLRIRSTLKYELQKASELPQILTLEQAAQFLNLTIREMIQILEDLPSMEIAGQIRFRRSQLEQWVESREHSLIRQKTRSTINNPFRIIKSAGG